MEATKKRPRRSFTQEFKSEAVRLVDTTDRSVWNVARDLGIAPKSLRDWMKQARVDAGKGPAGALTSEERAELTALRKENRQLKEDREILKKSGGVLRQRESVKYAFISKQSASHAVRDLCRNLSVSRSGYYASLRRPLSRHAIEDTRIAALVVNAFRMGRGSYGSPRVLAELRERGERTSQKRVARLMRERLLFGRIRRRWRSAASTIRAGLAEPNHLERQFDVEGPNRKWATDITYIKTWEGWLYLAVVIDLYSRRIVGWAIRDHLRTELIAEALVIAIGTRMPKPGLLHHSDQGSQYGSDDYRRLLAAHGIACSMSRRGNCWDNAVVESFFSSLKRELVYRRSWPTRDEASASIHEWIDFYNRDRRHSYLGFRSPDDYEQSHGQRSGFAA